MSHLLGQPGDPIVRRIQDWRVRSESLARGNRACEDGTVAQLRGGPLDVDPPRAPRGRGRRFFFYFLFMGLVW